MKKSWRSFSFGVDGGKTFIGIEPGTVFVIALGGGSEYRAPIEKIHAAMGRWHAKEHPTGKKRRRLLTSSEEMRRYRKEHPD
jgi:hypothetical protein